MFWLGWSQCSGTGRLKCWVTKYYRKLKMSSCHVVITMWSILHYIDKAISCQQDRKNAGIAQLNAGKISQEARAFLLLKPVGAKMSIRSNSSVRLLFDSYDADPVYSKQALRGRIPPLEQPRWQLAMSARAG